MVTNNLRFNHNSPQLCSLPLGQYVRKLGFQHGGSSKDIISLWGYTPLVESLTLCYMSVTDKDFVHMVSQCPKLKRCVLLGCGKITDIGIVSLTDFCPRLCDLDLQFNEGITPMVLVSLKNCSLEPLVVDLRFGANLCEPVIKLLLPASNESSSLFPMLNNFSIVGYNHIDPELLTAFIKSRPRLQKLDLSKYGVTDTIVDTIADSMPDIQYLDLFLNHRITSPAMERLVKACIKLTRLDPPHYGFFDGTYSFLDTFVLRSWNIKNWIFLGYLLIRRSEEGNGWGYMGLFSVD
ncbi:hypothetical protein BC941DRAFT_417322 [Chlamydoabsidia padenii]|nr:hypothetical protein BC941DRAFT_417322 [Chlamydoabsidia padenii]